MLREVMERLAQRGMTQRNIYGELGEGFSTTALSKMVKADKIPTPEQLRKLLALAETTVGKNFPAAARERLESANVSALQAVSSPLLQELAAQEDARRWQQTAEECRAREAFAEKELEKAAGALRDMQRQLTRGRGQLGRLLQEAQARLEDTAVRQDRERLQAEQELAAHRAVVADLEGGSERLTARVQQLQRNLRAFQAELEDAQRALEVALVRAEEAESSAAQDRNERRRLGEEVGILTDLLEQARAELAELKRERAERVADTDVLAEAEALVRKAQYLVRPESAAHAGGGSGIVSSPETTLSPARNVAAQGRSASAEEVARLTQQLVTEGETEAVGVLMTEVVQRPVPGIVSVMDALGEAGFYRQREQLTRMCAREGPEKFADLLLALHEKEAASEASWLIDEAARTPASTVKELVTLLLQRDRRAYARRILDETVPRAPVGEVTELIAVLEQAWPAEAVRLVQEATARRHARDLVVLLTGLGPASADAALETVARRPAAVIAEVLAQLRREESGTVAVRLSGHAGAASSAAEAAALATALDGHELVEDRERLLASFLQQQPGQSVALLEAWNATGDLHGPSAVRLLQHVGQSCSADEIRLVAAFTGTHGVADAELLTGVALRRPAEVQATLTALAEDDEELCARVLQQVVKSLPAAEAVDVVEHCLESGLGTVDITAVVATAAPGIQHLVGFAELLKNRDWPEEAWQVLRAAGSTGAHAWDELSSLLQAGLPSWALPPLLTGLLRSEPQVCRATISAMKAAGMDGYVRLMLEWGPPAGGVPELSACLLEDNALADYAAALHERLVRTASPQELAGELHKFPSEVISELITLASTRSAAYIAELIVCLSRAARGREILALVYTVAQGPPDRARELAVRLTRAGRNRQGSWLTRQADVMRHHGTGLPPAENLADALSAAQQVFDDQQIPAMRHILKDAVLNGDAAPRDLIGRLSLPVLESYVAYLLEEDGSVARQLLPSGAEDLALYLDSLPASSSVRVSLIRWAVLRTAVEQCAGMLGLLEKRGETADWRLAHEAAVGRSDFLTYLLAQGGALARRLLPSDAAGLTVLLHTAGSPARVPLVRLAVTLTSVEECVKVLGGLQELGTEEEQQAAYDAVARQRSAADIAKLIDLLAPTAASRLGGEVIRRAIAHHPLDTLRLLIEAAFRNALISERSELDVLLSARPDGPIAVAGLLAWIDGMYGPMDTYSRSAGYYVRNQTAEEARYWDGERWTNAVMPLSKDDPAIAALLSSHQVTVDLAVQPREKARASQQLVAALSYAKGPDRAETLRARKNYAYWLNRAGLYTQAYQVGALLVADCSRVLGQDHLDTLAARYDLAAATGHNGRPGEAARLLEQLVSDTTLILGATHLNTLRVALEQAEWVGRNGAPADAVQHLSHLVVALTEHHGADHQVTLDARRRNAVWTGISGNPEVSVKLLEELARLCTDVLGVNDRLTLATRTAHAQWLGRTGRLAPAERLLAALVDDSCGTFGRTAPETIEIRYIHAQTLKASGNRSRARLAREILAQLALELDTALGTDHPHVIDIRKAVTHWDQPD
ncbi:hypothetical protein AB0M58_38035 [Streptomyces bobili]|uniref:hypothetical protein n=1 Tax=Streptomyces bobili TaxID=67280 RepID=UPI003415CCC9